MEFRRVRFRSYFFFLFTLVTAIVFTKTEEVSAFSWPVNAGMQAEADTTIQPVPTKKQSADSVNATAILLKDNRKNKPKIFQDPVKTYDDRQLLFFTTFGFDDDYSTSKVAIQDMPDPETIRSEEHTSELKSLMRNSYSVLRMKKKKNKIINKTPENKPSN